MTFDLDSLLNILSIASQVVGAAATAAALIPQAKNAGPAIQTARQVIDILAMNVNNAKNAPKS